MSKKQSTIIMLLMFVSGENRKVKSVPPLCASDSGFVTYATCALAVRALVTKTKIEENINAMFRISLLVYANSEQCNRKMCGYKKIALKFF